MRDGIGVVRVLRSPGTMIAWRSGFSAQDSNSDF
jgi:hypothetical protein